VDGIVCVLDADQVFAYPEYPALLDLKLGQVGFADMLVLNKVNLAGPDQMDAVRGWLDAHFNRLRVVETSQCQVPLPLIFGVGASQHGHQNPDDADRHHEQQNHSGTFSTWSYQSTVPVSLASLRAALRALHGSVFRVKGILFAADDPDLRCVLQVVGRRIEITLGEPWGEEVPTTRVAAIGTREDLNREALETTMALSCAPSIG